MNNIVTTSILVWVLGMSSALAAASFEDDLVLLELVRILTGGDVYTSLPPGFPLVDLQPGHGLSVLGTLDRQYTHDVILASAMGATAGLTLLREAYLAQDWLEIGPVSQMSTQLCHDQLGILFMRQPSQPVNAADRVVVSWQDRIPSQPEQSCAARKAMAGGSESNLSFIAGLMPNLVLPAQSATSPVPPAWVSRGFVSLTGTGSNFELSRDDLVTVPTTTVAALYQQLQIQMAEQGWAADTQDAGERSAMAVWRKTVQTPATADQPGQELSLTGVLTLLWTGTDA